jgi:hypothetical protein
MIDVKVSTFRKSRPAAFTMPKWRLQAEGIDVSLVFATARDHAPHACSA